MAGPWYVDPENGLTTNDGLSPETPWQLIPGQTGATAQTGYGVVAGDIINIKNGTTTSLRFSAPANNLTYRGYGLASNKLVLTLPTQQNVSKTYQKTVVREEGVHEGMWTVSSDTETLSIVSLFSRSGCVLEDCYVKGPASETCISVGLSSASGTSATVRRCRINGSNKQGLQAYTTNVLFEDILIENVDEDGMTIAASATNSYRAGSVDIIRRISIINPGRDTTAAVGDAFQTLRISDQCEGFLSMEDIYVYKTSTVKQGLVFSDLVGGLSLKRFHLANGSTGTVQVLFTGVGGNFTIDQGYIEGGGSNNPIFRFTGAQGIETDKTLTIRNIVARNCTGGFFAWGSSEEACTVDGDVFIYNCSFDGLIKSNLSFSAGISCHPASQITIGANASLTAKNNFIGSTYENTTVGAIRLPSGDAGSAKWVFQNNYIVNPSFFIGSTNYATVDEFEFEHINAVNNLSGTINTYSNMAVKPNTALVHAGVFVGVLKDSTGNLYNNPPSIGAYEYIEERAVR